MATDAHDATETRRAYRLPQTRDTVQLFGEAIAAAQRRGDTDLRQATLLREGLKAFIAVCPPAEPSANVSPPILSDAHRLRAARMAKKLTQAEVATSSGVSRTFVANVEQGRTELAGRLGEWVREQEKERR